MLARMLVYSWLWLSMLSAHSHRISSTSWPKCSVHYAVYVTILNVLTERRTTSIASRSAYNSAAHSEEAEEEADAAPNRVRPTYNWPWAKTSLVNSYCSSPREKVLPWALFRVMAYACLSGYCLRSITSTCTSSQKWILGMKKRVLTPLVFDCWVMHSINRSLKWIFNFYDD